MYWYFPSDSATPISPRCRLLLRSSLDMLQQSKRKLPHSCAFDLAGMFIGIDANMDLNNGVLGYTNFWEEELLISPGVAKGLEYRYNNELAMGTIVHELTHRAQMRWLGGFLWPFLNAPVADQLTVERWANENGEAATEILTEEYAQLRS